MKDYKAINEGIIDAFKYGVKEGVFKRKTGKDPRVEWKYDDPISKKIKNEYQSGDTLTKFELLSANELGKKFGHVQAAAEEHPYLAAATGALAAGAGALGLRKLLKRRQQNKQVNQ